MKYWLISDAAAQAIRATLTGNTLHTLDSGLHATDAIPADAITPDMSARDFAARFLDPVAGLAHRASLVYAGIVAELEEDEEEEMHWLSSRASALQLGEGAFAREAVYDLMRDFADETRRG